MVKLIMKGAFVSCVFSIAALLFLLAQCSAFKPIPDNEIVRAIIEMEKVDDSSNSIRRANIISQFVPAEGGKEEASNILTDAGFECKEGRESARLYLKEKGVVLDELLDCTIRRGWMVTKVYWVRLGFAAKHISYTSAGKAITGP